MRIRRDQVGGAILLIVGAFLLALEFLPNLAFLIPLLIGLVLLGLFLLVRSPALLATGGVITGVGVGILTATQGSPDFGGAGVLVSIGCGFLLVSLFGTMFGIPSVRSWPLVPGLALIALGAVIYAAGLGQEVLEISARGWPALLVVVGGYLLLAARMHIPLHPEDAAYSGSVSDETDASVPVSHRGGDDRQEHEEADRRQAERAD